MDFKENQSNSDKIINRQLMRCKAELEQVNCPQLIIDCVFKYFNFARIDINSLIREMENDEINQKKSTKI